MALVIMIHGGSMVLSGALRGVGKQSIVTWIVLFSFYVIALPLSYTFAIALDVGINGLWFGPILGCSIELLISIVVLVIGIDWEDMALKITSRLL